MNLRVFAALTAACLLVSAGAAAETAPKKTAKAARPRYADTLIPALAPTKFLRAVNMWRAPR